MGETIKIEILLIFMAVAVSILATTTFTLLLKYAEQRIVGQNSQKSMLACILKNPTWYFWHTTFDIIYIYIYWDILFLAY